jgi:hypothetical protein
LLAGWGEDRRLALHGSTNKEKEKRELTDSFLNRRRGSVKPLPAEVHWPWDPVSPSAIYTGTFWWQQQHSLRRSMLDSLRSRSQSQSLDPFELPPKCSIKWKLPRASRSRAYAIAEWLLEPRKAGVEGICNAKGENMYEYESDWSHGGCLISQCMHSEGGRYRSLCGFSNTTKIISYPTMASTAMVAGCCRPTSPKRVI